MTQTRPKSLTSFLLVISLIDAFAGRVLFCWLFGTAPNMGAFGMFVGYNLACCLTAIPVIVYLCELHVAQARAACRARSMRRHGKAQTGNRTCQRRGPDTPAELPSNKFPLITSGCDR